MFGWRGNEARGKSSKVQGTDQIIRLDTPQEEEIANTFVEIYLCETDPKWLALLPHFNCLAY
jgi:hypothetical protein